jgi:hypothetical protein
MAPCLGFESEDPAQGTVPRLPGMRSRHKAPFSGFESEGPAHGPVPRAQAPSLRPRLMAQ